MNKCYALSAPRQMRSFLSSVTGLVIVVLLVASATAQEQTAPVSVELLAEANAMVPNQSLRVMFRLEHQPGWHTFWRSPGSGEATAVEWQLPNGWRTDTIDWPVPARIYSTSGDVSGYGYGDVIHLPVRLLAPADLPIGDSVTIKAELSWLACHYEHCLSNRARLALTLPVVAGEAVPNDAVRAALAATSMPEAGTGWEVSAQQIGDAVELQIATDEPLHDPYFFAHDELIWHDAEQHFQHTGTELIGTLPIDAFYDSEPTLLSGVLAFTDDAGRNRGLLVNAPITQPSVFDPSGVTVDPVPSIPAVPLSWKAFIGVLGLAFLGGLLLNLMPCVLPILSLKALSLVKVSQPAAVRMNGLAYTLGVVLSFVVIAGVLLVVRSLFETVGWGFQLQQPAVVIGLTLLMTMIGLNLIGAFEIGGSLQGIGHTLTDGDSHASSFFTGVLAVVVAAPCTAPFMASALGIALVQPAPVAVIVFVALGLGLAFPFLLISLFPRLRTLLPKPGAWTEMLKQILAFPMFATAIWLLWVLGGQTGKDGMALGLIAILCIGFTAWAFGRRGPGWCAASIAGLGLTIVAVFAVVQLPTGMSSERAGQDTSALFDEIAYMPAALDDLLVQDRVVFAYFTADWCITCKVNERVAINQPETAAFFEANDITVMVGDWTTQDPAITAILARYERAGVPMYLYFQPGASVADGVLLPQVLTPTILKNSIENT